MLPLAAFHEQPNVRRPVFTPSPSEPSELLPIAAEVVFRAHWLPMAGRLSLTWLPRYQTGETVPLPCLSDVVMEFEAMASGFFEAGEFEFASRASAVSMELRRLMGGHPLAEVFIG